MATVHSALTDLLDPLGDCMTPEVARKVVQLRASADANSRMQLLAHKSTAGTLTEEKKVPATIFVPPAAATPFRGAGLSAG